MCYFSYFVSHTRQQAIYVHFEKILKKTTFLPYYQLCLHRKMSKVCNEWHQPTRLQVHSCQTENNFTQLAICSTFHCSGYCKQQFAYQSIFPSVDPLFTVGWSPVGAPDWRKTQKSCSSFCTLFVKSYLFQML